MHVVTAPALLSPSVRDSSAPSSFEFRRVYDCYFRFAWRSLRRLGVHEADLMDMTQNVFVVVHRKLPDFEGRSELRTWLFGICHWIATDYRRSARVRHEVPVDARKIASLADPEPASDASEQAHFTALAEALLGRLPEKLRVAFVLFELDGLSGDDIAALLEVPVGTVRSRLRLARETFRREARRLERAGLDSAQVFG
jgi:RNA polymerase sigma-70 factor (ECF subfamily)